MSTFFVSFCYFVSLFHFLFFVCPIPLLENTGIFVYVAALVQKKSNKPLLEKLLMPHIIDAKKFFLASMVP